MNANVFADWLRAQGLHVVKTTNSYWVEAAPFIYQSFPYHWLIRPSDDEFKKMVSTTKCISLRYSTEVNVGIGKISYHVISSSGLELKPLPKKVRHDVSRGLAYANIQLISLDRLAVDGWLLRQETLARQGRTGAETQTWWNRLCLSAKGLPGFEAWGAVHEGELCAALLGFYHADDQCFSILYQQSKTDALKNGVNNALAYQVTNDVQKRNPGAWIFYGLHSLDAPESVDEFKFRMGFIAKPVRQRVVFHPLLQPFVNGSSYKMLELVQRAVPGNHLLSKAEGMLRFYLEGKKPLIEQSWPSILEDQRGTLMAQDC